MSKKLQSLFFSFSYLGIYFLLFIQKTPFYVKNHINITNQLDKHLYQIVF